MRRFFGAAVIIACDNGHYISNFSNCQISKIELFMNFAQKQLSDYGKSMKILSSF